MRCIFQQKSFGVICITKTKLTDDQPTNKCEINGYELYRVDTKKLGKTGDGCGSIPCQRNQKQGDIQMNVFDFDGIWYIDL